MVEKVSKEVTTNKNNKVKVTQSRTTALRKHTLQPNLQFVHERKGVELKKEPA